jgi:hypothetical protein
MEFVGGLAIQSAMENFAATFPGAEISGGGSDLSLAAACLALIFAVLAGICGVVCLVSVAMKRPTPPSPESPGVPER